MVVRDVLQAMVIFVGLPAAAIIGCLVSLGLAFGGVSGWRQVGVTVASGIRDMLTWSV